MDGNRQWWIVSYWQAGFTSLALAFSTAVLAETRPGVPEVDVVVDRIAARLASEASGGSEFRRARWTTLAIPDADGQPRGISIFTIEGIGGGNNFTQYMTLLDTDAEHVRFIEADTWIVGGKGIRLLVANELSIREGLIVVPTLSYAERDALCCPSMPGDARFEIRGGKLHERVD